MSLFKDAYDITKDLLNAAKEDGYQDLADKAMAIQAKLFEFKEENENLKDEIKKLQDQLTSLTKKAEIEETLIPHTSPYFTQKGDTLDRFFCAHCWQSEQKLMQIQYYGDTRYYCPHCKSDIFIMRDKQ